MAETAPNNEQKTTLQSSEDTSSTRLNEANGTNESISPNTNDDAIIPSYPSTRNDDDDDKRPSKGFWWDALVRNVGENRLALKSGTAIAALIATILWMTYKYYWKSRNTFRQNNNNNFKKKRPTTLSTKLTSFPLWWSFWWLRWWNQSRRTSDKSTSTIINYTSAPRTSQLVPLSVLMQAAKSGLVERALFRASQIWFQTNNNTNGNSSTSSWQTAHLPPASPYNNNNLQAQLQTDLMELLQRSGATISALPDSIWQRMATPALAALPFVYLALLYRMMHKLQHGDHDTNGTTATDNNTTSTTTFADVAGLDHVVTEVAEVVHYLHHPEAYHGVGARPPRAILLHGPPGSGKTLLARAVAGEAHTLFFACSASEFVETYVGRGAARVRSVFRNAKRQAKKRHAQQQRQQRTSSQNSCRNNKTATAILFIDELDALAKTRSSGLLASNNDERDQTLNQLLTEMDGFHQTGEGDDVTIIVMAATNRADVLDPAILRRFDRQVHVGYPDAQGRKAILQVHAKKIKCDDQDNNIRWDYLASEDLTPNFSGADLRNVINEAALLAVRDHSDTVNEQHLVHAAQRIRDMKIRLQQPTHSHRHFVPPFSLDEFH